MVANYHELEFTHFVIDNSDGAVFGSARVNGSGRIANFLISEQEVRQQQGDGWLSIHPDSADIVRRKATAAYGRVSTYRTERLLLS